MLAPLSAGVSFPGASSLPEEAITTTAETATAATRTASSTNSGFRRLRGPGPSPGSRGWDGAPSPYEDAGGPKPPPGGGASFGGPGGWDGMAIPTRVAPSHRNE
ncbi:hypothetical protein GCM10027074_17780 [Streptomyces deserti]